MHTVIRTFVLVAMILGNVAAFYIFVPWVYGRWLRLRLKKKASSLGAIVLTFDDGPGSRLTPAILNLLAEFNAKATFFLLGKRIVGRESIVKRIEADGHEICSHGYDHIHYWKVSPFRSISDIKRGWQSIDKALGRRQCVYAFRPPYGKLNLLCLLYLWGRKVPIFYWTLVSGDTWPVEKRDPRRVSLLATKAGGAVVLAHDFDRTDSDIDNAVLDSLRLMLQKAQKTGMRVMTVSELVNNKRED